MKRFVIPRRPNILLVSVLTFSLITNPAFATSPVKLQNWKGAIDFSTDGPVPFSLEGTASHLGQFTATGEVEFSRDEEDGSFVGDGVVVFKAANGDLLVGAVMWDVDPAVDGYSTSSVHFSWRDSVQFDDGRVVKSTGRFAKAEGRPPGLVVIAIIAILIGLLLPAVQK